LPGVTNRCHSEIHFARTGPQHLGLLDDGREDLFTAPAALRKAQETAPLAELGNLHMDHPPPRFPVPVAVAIALSRALGGRS